MVLLWYCGRVGVVCPSHAWCCGVDGKVCPFCKPVSISDGGDGCDLFCDGIVQGTRNGFGGSSR